MPPGTVDERGLVLLKRKLEALNYTEPLDAASASLVNHLVSDLIRTTDSYRSIKLQASQYAQEVATFNTKVGSKCCCYRHTGTRADDHYIMS
jgi:uncharacterized protein with ATP-grasp and redox domains